MLRENQILEEATVFFAARRKKSGLRFEYIHRHAEKLGIALYCRVLGVTPQGYAKHMHNLTKPYKYAKLLAEIQAILTDDEFNIKMEREGCSRNYSMITTAPTSTTRLPGLRVKMGCCTNRISLRD